MWENEQMMDEQRAKTCCVAGHRDIPVEQAEHVKEELRIEVNQAIEDGYLYFLTDFMEGADQLFAAIVAEIREENDAIRLEAILPYRSRYEKLFNDKKAKPLLLACTDVCFSGEKYSPNNYMVCRRKQIERSSRMITVFDGRSEGGTVKAIRMAHIHQVPIREIPLGL